MKQYLRIAAQTGIVLLTCAALSATASAEEHAGGWVTENGRRFYCTESGERLTGEQAIDGISYLFAPNGAQQLGWQTIENRRYYYDTQTGEAVFGFIRWRGERYYVSEEYGKCTGFFEADGNRCYADSCGVLSHDSWLRDEDGLHYADSDGIFAAGEYQIDGGTFLFDENGSLKTGFQTASDGSTRYYLETETCGIIQKGWFSADDQTYLADENGLLYRGILETADGITAFDENGAQCVGWHEFDGRMYYFDSDCLAVCGLTVLDNETYYFDETGIMQTGSIIVNDTPCYFDTDGKRIDGFRQTENGTIYHDAHTGQQAFGWQEIDGETYYFDDTGIMAVDYADIEGIRYHFLENGIYKPVKICLDAGHFAKYNHSPVNPAYWESDFNWKLHLYLKAELEQYGIEVITTRPDKDTDLALADRGKASEGCDLFLSLHSNASNNASDDGPLACCTVTGVCNTLGLDLANLVADVMDTSQRGSIWNRYSGSTPGADYYGVLRSATAVGTPAILLEHSYHTNLRATNWLLEDENVKKLAVAEGEFLARYFDMIPC